MHRSVSNSRWISTGCQIRFLAVPLPLCLSVLMTFFSVAADEPVDYLKKIKPILSSRCFACHGALKQEGGLRLDTAAQAIKGGDSGPSLVPGEVDASLLMKRISATDESERMPPEGEPLRADQIAAIRNWISQKAPAPTDEQPERHPRDHWAFKPVVRPEIPQIQNGLSDEQGRWRRNPIDAFISKEHRQRGLMPQSEADRRIWLRRVSLDLVGLPPTTTELEAFVADQSSEAHDNVVTRLLESPQYGERWGRHWMDIWRYSDWWGLGAEVRNSQKHIWHWRDWIIESLNSDKPYDQMLREMLAADELYPNDLDRLRANGYLARQYFIFNRTTWMDETIEHTAKGMLGLTLNCAKCHDHKYDPFSHVDYYSMRAIFEPYQIRTEMVANQIDYERDGIPRAFDAHLDIPTYLHVRGDDRNPDKSQSIPPGIPAILVSDELKLAIEPIALPIEAPYPGLRDFVVQSHLNAARYQLSSARAAVEAANSKLLESEAAAKVIADAAARAALEVADALVPANSPVVEKKPEVKPGSPAPMPVDQARLAVAIAQKTCRTAETQLTSIEARAAADRAFCLEVPSAIAAFNTGEDSELRAASDPIAVAVKSEAILAAARADEECSRAELALLQAAADKKVEAEKKLTNAKTALETAMKAIDKPRQTHTPLSGAKKTQEDYQNRNADKPFPIASSGRRAAFAKWLTDSRNPLTARVAINHIWTRHMGKPLVPTVFDFGRKGTPPTHPELLDWLASELVEHNWSMKHIHRLIVSSETYRMSSSSAQITDATLAADPENRFYWRMNPIRMDSEVVRDSLLHLAGELDMTMGGPSIPVNDEKSRRRSLYFVHSHNDHQQFLSTFDDASVLDCYRRAESIVPQQALALENSSFVTTMAGKITQRVATAQPEASDVDFIRAAFISVLSSEPTSEERETISDVLKRMNELARAKKRENPELVARKATVQTLINLNDFITIR